MAAPSAPSASSPALHVLLVEDRTEDAELVARELKRAELSCDILRVDTAKAFRRALVEFSPEIVLADYTVPGFGGMAALEILKKEAPAIPFIVVTGSLDEETAAECIKAGAADYVLKTNLVRLGPAVRSALALAGSQARARSLEAQLALSQRMEAVGRLAGGVAHDFNNILTAISGYADLLLTDLPEGDNRRRDVEEIHQAAQRAASLTQQLLAFSRRQVLQPKVVDLNALVRDVEKMLRRLIGEDILFATVLHPRVGNVRADPGQLEQVIVNLAVNARDAMPAPAGGRLTIETRNVELDESYAADHPPVKPGQYVLLAVSDTGVGMDEETKARIFEPFFTTKARGKGTGLGLATVYGIVRQTGGHIWAYSEPGKGTTMRVYLPRVDEPADPLERPGDSAPEELRGSETILVVEDEAPVRAVTRQLLERNGYTVLEAADGPSALALVDSKDGQAPIQLLLTDVIMPGMSGRELASQLKARLPNLRVLYMSGYTDDAVVRHGMLEPGLAYLEKPFRPQTLLRKIRQTLREGAAGNQKNR
jgi:two-component system, cell cycle sensor histidine kinase and response regulator CckA